MAAYYDHMETMTVSERINRSNLLLSDMINLAYQKSNRVRQTFNELKLNPHDIKSLSDFTSFPIISREKLVELETADSPFGGLCNPDVEIERIFISPGPVYEPHLSETDPLWARAYFAAGLGKGDIVLNAFSYHMVAAGLTFHNGLRAVGATVVPVGTSSTQIQVQLIRDIGITAYTGTPSFLLSIIKKAEEMGYDFKKDFKLKRACFAAEPLEKSLRYKFEHDYNIDTFQMYGATEVGDIAYECSEKKGWHICEEVIVEIVDPFTGKEVEAGLLGEIVVTRLNHIFFLFRFGTGDISRIITDSCPCGRTSYRLDNIAGRLGDAIKVRGLFIAPSQLNKISERFDNLRFQVLVNRSAHEDYLTVKIENKDATINSSLLEDNFRDYFKEICTVRIDQVDIIEPGALGTDYKVIIDHRTWT